MPAPVPLSAETIRQRLSEMLGTPISAADAEAVAALLAALATDTEALRAMPVDQRQSVLLYEARP